MSQTADSSTIPSTDSGRHRSESRLRLLSLLLIGGLVATATIGLLGVKTTETVASNNGYTLAVSHAAVSRPGLATPLSIEITSDSGVLPSSVTVRVSSAYLALFDDNGMEPAPVESFNTNEWTWWTFDVPADSASIRVDLDARLEPAVQRGRTAVAAVEIAGEEVVATEFSTWVAP